MIKTVHPKGSEVIKIGSGCNLKRGLPLKTGMPLIAKAIKDEKNTSHRYLKDYEEYLEARRVFGYNTLSYAP